ncbi:hypothetical protein [Streptomyces sp. NPDC058268]|uniref:hypothetical protein n=1 Tax=Streptomyces sp. NPDC058268 TaxID=3346413 RepID=UPI0036E04DC5
MPRIKLAHWHDGHAPGDEIDVNDTELKELRRDGRVASVVETVPQAQAEPVPGPPAAAEKLRKTR